MSKPPSIDELFQMEAFNTLRERANELERELNASQARERRLREALAACSDKLERVSAAARGDNGHSEHTLNVLAQARAALSSPRQKGQP